MPTSGWGYQWGNGPAWDSAFVLIPWYLYDYCGDTRVFAEHYDGMKRYVDYMTSKAKKDHLVSHRPGRLGALQTATPVISPRRGYYYVDAPIVARRPRRLLGKSRRRQEIRRPGRQPFGKRSMPNFYTGNGVYANGSQTALSCALYQGLADPRQGPSSSPDSPQTSSSTTTISTRASWARNTSFTRSATTADTIWPTALPRRTTPPSWGYGLSAAPRRSGKTGTAAARSNHVMFGDISAWFYKTLAGINVDPASPAFKHFIIKPNVVGDLTSARAAYNSIRGPIVSDWKTDKEGLHLTVTIPANTTATVSLPGEALPRSLRAKGRQPRPRAWNSGASRMDAPSWSSAPAPISSPRRSSAARRRMKSEPEGRSSKEGRNPNSEVPCTVVALGRERQ